MINKYYFIPLVLLIYSLYRTFFTPKLYDKTYYINSNNYVKYNIEIIDYILKSKNWMKLDPNNLNIHNKIGFVISDNDKKNILKSQITYGCYLEDKNVFNSNIYLIDNIVNKDFICDSHLIKKESILKDINKLYEIINKLNSKIFILKDLMDNNKILISKNKKDNDIIIKNIKEFKSKFIVVESYYESFKFKVKELSYNNIKLNAENIIGRRTKINFFILVINIKDKIRFFRINDFLIYLSILPVSNNLNNLESYFTGYYNKSKNLSDNKKLNLNTYNKILTTDEYPKDFYTRLFCISNYSLKKSNKTLYNKIHSSINNFIKSFGESFKNKLISKNDSFYNKNFYSAFNIYNVSSVYTEDGNLKILNIKDNFLNIDFSILKYNESFNLRKIYNDIFSIFESKNNFNSIELIDEYPIYKIQKMYYLSDYQVGTYPEFISILKKRNYTRSLWRNQLNSKNSIYLYLGYIVKNKFFDEDDKDEYLNYLFNFFKTYSIGNKIYGSVYKLGDKISLYKQLKKTSYIADFVDFVVLANEKNNNFISTSELLKVQNFINVNQSTCNRFILKPSLGSQGDGIEIIRFYEDFEEWVKTPKKYKEWTLCELLEPKLFYSRKINDNKKRKAHVRSYFIISNHNNKINIYELKNRVIYFAVDKYISKCVKIDEENKYSFITNLALASEERNVEYDTKDYSDDLLNYQDQIFNFRKFSRTITEYGLKCIQLLNDSDFKCFNISNKSKGCYQILAIDYLPINKNQIKILEVNKGPGFKALKVNFDLKVILDEIFSVTIDLFDGIDNNINLTVLNKIV